MEAKRIEFPAWYGEFGWEVMTWIPVLRRKSRGHDQIIATSFAGMGPLYADFVTEFREHGQPNRSLDYPKAYRAEGEHLRYGDAAKAPIRCDVLFHARGISRKSSINYAKWKELSLELINKPDLSFGWIGSKNDRAVPGWALDIRGIGLQKLLNQIAAAKVVVGVSSGVMHLAAACGTDLVVWGDGRTYFNETLEKRYKQTWNPHNVRVGWITAADWQPEPDRIVTEIERMLEP